MYLPMGLKPWSVIGDLAGLCCNWFFVARLQYGSSRNAARDYCCEQDCVRRRGMRFAGKELFGDAAGRGADDGKFRSLDTTGFSHC